MLQALAKSWWILLIRGVVAVLLGLMLWFRPESSLAVLVLFFGAWMLVDGAFTVVGSIAGRKEHEDWGWMLVSGIMSVILGVLTLRAPGITTIVLVLYVATWAIMIGIGQIALGWRIRRETRDEWMLYLGGGVSLVFGVSVLWNPGAGALSIVWMIALFALLFGISLIGLSLRLRRLAARLSRDTP